MFKVDSLKSPPTADALIHGMEEQRENEIVVFTEGAKDVSVTQEGSIVFVSGTVGGKNLRRQFDVGIKKIGKVTIGREKTLVELA